MAVLRGEIPVNEECLLEDGLLHDRLQHKYTLLHLAHIIHADSHRTDIGFKTDLVSENDELVELTIKPDTHGTRGIDPTELVIRVVATQALSTTIRRYILPYDPEFQEQRFILSEAETREVTYGRVQTDPTTSFSFDETARRFQPNNDKIFYLRSVLWLPDNHPSVARSRPISDAWSE